MNVNDIDFTSDLNNGTDVSAHGSDTVPVGSTPPTGTEQAGTAQKVGNTEAPAKEPASKPLSLRDQISSALKGESETPPAAQKDGGRPRNADGTFAAAAPVDPATPPVDPANTGAPAAAAPAQVPHGLVGFDQQTFSALPAETQAQLARTMEHFQQAQQQYQQLGQIEQLIAPRRQAWALNGMTDAQALNQLLALSDFASRDMPGFLRYMAENGGVSLEDLSRSAPVVDPTIAALQSKITALEGARNEDQRRQQQAAHENTVSSVVAFASEKGQDGNLLRPHFEELGSAILPYIQAVKAQNPNWSQNQVLQQAYENAVWATPSTRAKMQAAANAAAEAERMRVAAANVGKKQAASVSVRSGAPASPNPAPAGGGGDMSLRDTIRASIAAAS